MKTYNNTLLVFLICVLLAPCLAFICQARAASSQAKESSVFVQDNTVRVNLREAPLGEVIEQIANQSHLKVWVSPKAAGQPLTDHFTGLPLDAALQRLLRGMNYALLFSRIDTTGEVSGVYVLSAEDRTPLNSAPSIPTSNTDLHAYIQAQNPDFFPAGIREALLELTERDTKMEESARDQRREALTRLVELLKTAGHGETETTRRLEEYIRRQP